MGKLAIISDIHGNFEALTAVLADIDAQGITDIFCLGDVIGYGPNPRECIDTCRGFNVTLLGNHDNGALFDPEGFSSGAERAIFWTRAQLEDQVRTAPRNAGIFWLNCLGPTGKMKSCLFMALRAVHSTSMCFRKTYITSEKIERIFGFIQKYCFQGHTHVPGIFTENFRFYSPGEVSNSYTLSDQKLMINVGSVGQPRDSDPRCSYVVLEDSEIEFRRVEYDPQATRSKIHAIPELDDFLGDRLLEGR